MFGRKIIIISAAIFLLSLLPSTLRVLSFASDAYGLTVIAVDAQGSWSLNPYSKNFMPLSSSMAMRILKNSEYPYSHCSELSRGMGSCHISHIAWVGRMMDKNQPEAVKRGLELIQYFVSRGEPLNEKSNGLTPIHEAILFNNPKYLDALLKAGASPLVKSDPNSKGRAALDAYEYLQLLDTKEPNLRIEIHRIFVQQQDGR